MNISFIGLGVMGYPMAGYVAKAHTGVRVFNRTAAKAADHTAAYGTQACATVAEATAGCEIVLACVGGFDDAAGSAARAAFAVMAPGGIYVDHATTSAMLARTLAAEAAALGLHYLDAPVSGGQKGAETGQLTVMVGGDAAIFARAEPVIRCYAKAITHMGESGTGQLAKMVNQICIAGVVQGLAEAVHFAQKAGLDPEKTLAAISKGSAQSWQMENRWMTMSRGEFDFGFAVDWMRKDLGFVLDEARRTGAAIPSTAMIDQFYAEVQAMGGNRWDTSSLVARLNR
jgi:3-hydroxyisobutyrate dehydrogenase-like beta-hydroxyacid dehydrogenase